MRASSIIIGFGVGVLALGLAGMAGWHTGAVLWAGATGLGLGMAVSEAAGLLAWWRAEMSHIANRDALTRATDAATAERMARLAMVEVAAPEPADGADLANEHAWRVVFGRVIQAGALHGFRYRDIAAGPHKVVEWEDWPELREPLIEMGVLVERSGTRFADDWTLARWQREGALLPLPHLEGEPPRVEITVNTAQQQRPTTPQRASEVVVDA